MKIYIAGPMTGHPEYNYPAFHEAAEKLRAKGYEVVCPTESEKLHGGPKFSQTWDWYLRQAIKMLVDCEAVALLPGWETSRGALLEYNLAVALGMDVRGLSEFVGS